MTPTTAFLLLTLAGPCYPVPGVAISFESIIQRYSQAYKVPAWLCRRVAFAESSWRPGVVGPRGESRGLYQINRRFEDDLAWRAGLTRFDWRNPDHSARVGIAYLSRLIAKYDGDLRLAVAAYNFGPGNVDKGRAWPAETREYVRRVLQ